MALDSVFLDNQTRLDEVLKKIGDHSTSVAVVGLGYVGLPFAVEKAKMGFSVLGIDANPARVAKVNSATNYINDVDDVEFAELVGKGLIRATPSFEEIPNHDVIVVAVPTPLNKNLAPDLQYIVKVTESIAPYLRKGHLVCLESTTYPGTTEEIMLPILLAKSGLKVDEDFYLAHSPERVDPGNKRYTTKNTCKVVGGVGPNSLKVAEAFYSQTLERVVAVSSAKVAEMTKVFENTFRAVNIALVNELALLCDRMQISVWEVLDAANTKPFGIMPFYPGPGVGGHCIPLDPHYLEWKAKEYNFNTHFIALAGEINRSMPEFVIEKTMRVLNDSGVALSRAKILILGMSYKKDLGDWRESPSIEIIHDMLKHGANVSYHDPHVPEIQIDGQTMHSVDLTVQALEQANLVLILTDHSAVDYQLVVDHAKHVFDTRFATRKVDAKGKVTLL